ncbi:MAG: hypothetical protein MR828_08345 [Clostridiales bacterium]|nr:hypothetical protein [Clostridiales bacterium]
MDQTAVPFLRQFLAKYKHALLILLVGILLMLLPAGERTSQQAEQTLPAETKQETQTLQEQLSALLSQMEGAGKVQVLLTLATGEKTLYQINEDSTTASQSETKRTDTVIINDSNRNEAGLVRQVDPPTYLGAVVLCQGAENSAVRLAITEAVSNATGLGYHKITILKMK